ncbi:hypothetical protein [Cyclobacterium marinum]|nr:hypothetical protein [Cyclobacterium marinum]|tara:strand:- start:2129 stop:2926 length:798 start_codon:yes stop_codon:yes gene_type:complete
MRRHKDSSKALQQEKVVLKLWKFVKELLKEDKLGIAFDFKKKAESDIKFYTTVKTLLTEYAKLKSMQFNDVLNRFEDVLKRKLNDADKEYLKTLWDELKKETSKPKTELEPRIDNPVNEEISNDLKSDQFESTKKEFAENVNSKTDNRTKIYGESNFIMKWIAERKVTTNKLIGFQFIYFGIMIGLAYTLGALNSVILYGGKTIDEWRLIESKVRYERELFIWVGSSGVKGEEVFNWGLFYNVFIYLFILDLIIIGLVFWSRQED